MWIVRIVNKGIEAFSGSGEAFHVRIESEKGVFYVNHGYAGGGSLWVRGRDQALLQFREDGIGSENFFALTIVGEFIDGFGAAGPVIKSSIVKLSAAKCSTGRISAGNSCLGSTFSWLIKSIFH